MSGSRFLGIAFVAALICNGCYSKITSSPNASSFDVSITELTKVRTDLSMALKKGDIKNLSEDQKTKYTTLNRQWIEALQKLFEMIDEAIPKMANKLGLGGMDARNQQLVKDTKKIIVQKNALLFVDLINGVKDVSTLKFRAEEVAKAIAAIEPKGNDKPKTIEIKEALKTVLNLLSDMYSTVIFKAKGK